MLHRLKRYERWPRESFLNRGGFPSPARWGGLALIDVRL
jgi:hypothetical protein